PTSEADLGVEFEVLELPDRRWRLARAEELDERSLLEGVVRLRDSSGLTLERHPRRVVPLRKDPLLAAFVEVERMGLGEDGMILCQTTLLRIVRRALDQVARPGFREVSPPPAGCPTGWCVLADVQVLSPLLSDPKVANSWPLDLNVLQPLATSQLVL